MQSIQPTYPRPPHLKSLKSRADKPNRPQPQWPISRLSSPRTPLLVSQPPSLHLPLPLPKHKHLTDPPPLSCRALLPRNRNSLSHLLLGANPVQRKRRDPDAGGRGEHRADDGAVHREPERGAGGGGLVAGQGRQGQRVLDVHGLFWGDEFRL